MMFFAAIFEMKQCDRCFNIIGLLHMAKHDIDISLAP